jgi:hypothetical protein
MTNHYPEGTCHDKLSAELARKVRTPYGSQATTNPSIVVAPITLSGTEHQPVEAEERLST